MNKTLIIVVIMAANILLYHAQPDTLNKLNSQGKKQGYWLCYLDDQFKPTDSIKGVYVGFDLYDNGENLTEIKRPRQSKNEKLIDSLIPSSNMFGRFKLLNGKILFYNKKNQLVVGKVFSQGYLLKKYVTFKSGHPNRDCLEEMLEIVDFTIQYKSMRGTAYVEYRHCRGGFSGKYWFRKHNGKWGLYNVNMKP